MKGLKVDPVDKHFLSEFTWRVHQGYASAQVWRNGKTHRVYLHRLILNLKDPRHLTDHINGDRLDNRRKNLRVVDFQTSNQNVSGHRNSSSRFRGVSWDKRAKKWEASAKMNYKKIHLGYFELEEDAAQVASEFRKEFYGGYVDRVH